MLKDQKTECKELEGKLTHICIGEILSIYLKLIEIDKFRSILTLLIGGVGRIHNIDVKRVT